MGIIYYYWAVIATYIIRQFEVHCKNCGLGGTKGIQFLVFKTTTATMATTAFTGYAGFTRQSHKMVTHPNTIP